MGPIFKFLSSLRSLAKGKNITIDEAYKAAQQEFGEVSDLLKLQINKIFKDVEAPSIRKPSKPEGKLIEASFKPGKDKYGKVVEESPSQKGKTFDELLAEEKAKTPLMERLEKQKDALFNLLSRNPTRPGGGLDPTTGMARTAARVVLDNAGIKVPEKVDPLKVIEEEYGADVLSDLRDVADELLEKEKTGITESMGEFLEKRGMFDLQRGRTDKPRPYTDEEMREIEKAIKEEDMLFRFDPKDREPNATGGRVGFAAGGIKGLLKLINTKFGKGTLKTADEIERPESAKEKEMFKDFEKRTDKKRQLTDDEIKEYEEELGDSETWLSEGTVEEAEQALKNQKEYEAAMYRDYRAGKLDPQPGEKGRKEFLEKKLEEMEMSGDKKLMTVDEIEELSTIDLESEMNVAKSLAPKMVERLELKQKYPGITDDLVDKILVDDNMQRKAEVLATLDEAFKMMEKGKGPEEVLNTIKNVTRTKQAGGGLAYLMGL